MVEMLVTLAGAMLFAAAISFGMGLLIANTGGLRVNTRWETGADGCQQLVSDPNPWLARIGFPLMVLALAGRGQKSPVG